MEVNKIILMEAIENLEEFDGLFKTTDFDICVSGSGTVIDYIMLDDEDGIIKFFAGDNPTYDDGYCTELILTADEQNYVLKEFNELMDRQNSVMSELINELIDEQKQNSVLKEFNELV